MDLDGWDGPAEFGVILDEAPKKDSSLDCPGVGASLAFFFGRLGEAGAEARERLDILL